MGNVCSGGQERLHASCLDGTGRAESCVGIEEHNLLLPFDGWLLQSILLQSSFPRAFV